MNTNITPMLSIIKSTRKIILLCAAIVLLVFIYPTDTAAQFNNRNSLNLDLGGHGLYYSGSYERVILNSERFKTVGDIGIAWYPEKTGIIELWIPTVFSELISFGQHHLEIGLGHVYINDHLKPQDYESAGFSWEHFLTGRIGYRYQKSDGHLIIKTAFTPFVEYGIYSQNPGPNVPPRKIDFREFHPSAGISIGYAF